MWWVYFCARGVEVGVLLCILGTVVRYKIISVDDQRFGQILFLGFLKKDVTSNSILANNRDSGEKEEAFR